MGFTKLYLDLLGYWWFLMGSIRFYRASPGGYWVLCGCTGFSKFEPLTTILRKDDILQFENIVNFFMLMNREINHKSHFFDKLIY